MRIRKYYNLIPQLQFKFTYKRPSPLKTTFELCILCILILSRTYFLITQFTTYINTNWLNKNESTVKCLPYLQIMIIKSTAYYFIAVCRLIKSQHESNQNLKRNFWPRKNKLFFFWLLCCHIPFIVQHAIGNQLTLVHGPKK